MEGRTVFRRARVLLRRHPVSIALIGIFVLYFLTRLLFLGRLPVFFDESIYIRWSQQALRGGKLLVSLTDGKPPLHVWLMIPFVSLFKDPLIAGRLASVAAGALTVWGMFLLGLEIQDRRLGLTSAFLYVVCPFTLWYDRVAITEGLLLTLFVFAAYFALRAARTLNPWWILPIAACLGLGLLTKGTAQLLFVILPFAYLVRDGASSQVNVRRPFLRWVGVLLCSFVLAFGIYSLLRFSSMYHMIGIRSAITTKGFGEVLRHPFDVFFSNMGAIAGTLVVFMTPPLLIAGLAGLLYGLIRKMRGVYFLWVWVLVVAVIEAFISKHWMFETILPRLFHCILPPLLLAAAYAVVKGLEALRGWKASSAAVWALTACLVLVALLAFPFYTDALILADPSAAPLPKWVRAQYITDWPSGWGIADSVDFLKKVSNHGSLVVGSNIKGIGLPTDGLLMYLSENKRVRVVPFSFTAREFPAELVEASREYPTYVVFNSFPGHLRPPAEWPLDLIKKFPKDGNNSQHLYLLKVKTGVPP
jgi:4-amino-4-deoxy-L-arabinose transferase-like glycosyltransferase